MVLLPTTMSGWSHTDTSREEQRVLDGNPERLYLVTSTTDEEDYFYWKVTVLGPSGTIQLWVREACVMYQYRR